MPQKPSNKINRLAVEFNYGNEQKKNQLQNILEDFVRYDLPKIIENELKQFESGREIICVDKIQINIENLDPSNPTQDFTNKFREQFRKQIPNIKKRQVLKKQKHSRTEALLFFLEYGFMPWWSEQNKSFNINEEINTLLLSGKLATNNKQQLIKLLQNTISSQRLLINTSPATREKIVNLLSNTTLYSQIYKLLFSSIKNKTNKYSELVNDWYRFVFDEIESKSIQLNKLAAYLIELEKKYDISFNESLKSDSLITNFNKASANNQHLASIRNNYNDLKQNDSNFSEKRKEKKEIFKSDLKYISENLLLYLLQRGQLPDEYTYFSNYQLISILKESIQASTKNEIINELFKNNKSILILSVLLSYSQLIELILEIIPDLHKAFVTINRWMEQQSIKNIFPKYSPLTFNELFKSPLISTLNSATTYQEMLILVGAMAFIFQSKNAKQDVLTIINLFEKKDDLVSPKLISKTKLIKAIKKLVKASKSEFTQKKGDVKTQHLIDLKELPFHFFETLISHYFTYNKFPLWFINSSWYKLYSYSETNSLNKTESVFLYLLSTAHAEFKTDFKLFLSAIISTDHLSSKIVYSYHHILTEQIIEILVGPNTFKDLLQFVKTIEYSQKHERTAAFFRESLYKSILTNNAIKHINEHAIWFFVSFFNITIKQLTHFIREHQLNIFQEKNIKELYKNKPAINAAHIHTSLTLELLVDYFKTFVNYGFLPSDSFYINNENMQNLIFNYVKNQIQNQQYLINQTFSLSQFNALLKQLNKRQLNKLAYNNETGFTQKYIEQFINDLTSLTSGNKALKTDSQSWEELTKTIIREIVFQSGQKLNQYEFAAHMLFNWLKSINNANKHEIISYIITQNKSSLIMNLFSYNWLEFHYNESLFAEGKQSVIKETRTGMEIGFVFTEQKRKPTELIEQQVSFETKLITDNKADNISKLQKGVKELNGLIFYLKYKFYPWWANKSEIGDYILSISKTQIESHAKEYKQILKLLSNTQLWYELNEALAKLFFTKLLNLLSIPKLDTCWKITLNYIEKLHESHININTQNLKKNTLNYLLLYAKDLKQISPENFEIELINYLAEQYPESITALNSETKSKPPTKLKQEFILAIENDFKLKRENDFIAILKQQIHEFFNSKTVKTNYNELSKWFTQYSLLLKNILQKDTFNSKSFLELIARLEADKIIQFSEDKIVNPAINVQNSQMYNQLTERINLLIINILKKGSSVKTNLLLSKLLDTIQQTVSELNYSFNDEKFVAELKQDSLWKNFTSNKVHVKLDNIANLIAQLINENIVSNHTKTNIESLKPTERELSETKTTNQKEDTKPINKTSTISDNVAIKLNFDFLYKQSLIERVDKTTLLVNSTVEQILKHSSIQNYTTEFETYFEFIKKQVLLISLPNEQLELTDVKKIKQTPEIESANKILSVTTEYLKELIITQNIDPFNANNAIVETVSKNEQKETELTNDEQLKATTFALLHEIFIVCLQQNISADELIKPKLAKDIYAEFSLAKTGSLISIVSQFLIQSNLLNNDFATALEAVEQFTISLESDQRMQNGLLSALLLQNKVDIVKQIEEHIPLKKDAMPAFNEVLNPAQKEQSDHSIEQYYQEQLEWSSDIDANEKIYISNSGLVLLWPFLSRFFKNEKLIENNNFISVKKATKAINLLQYIATGQTQMPEFMLPLNKILCNVDVTFPINTDIDISDEEKKRCDTFLKAVMQQWPSMKGTSIEGFRESFLMRNGVLVKSSDDWNLKVEQNTIDTLFITLTWGVGMIKLPWNKYLIFTEWN